MKLMEMNRHANRHDYVEEAWLRSYQIRGLEQTQQEAQGQPLLGNSHPEGPSPSTYRGVDRLPGNNRTYTSSHGVLRVGRLVLFHQETRHPVPARSHQRHGGEISKPHSRRVKRSRRSAFLKATSQCSGVSPEQELHSSRRQAAESPSGPIAGLLCQSKTRSGTVCRP